MDNDVADALSRAHLGGGDECRAASLVGKYGLELISPCLFFLDNMNVHLYSRSGLVIATHQGGGPAGYGAGTRDHGQPQVGSRDIHRIHEPIQQGPHDPNSGHVMRLHRVHGPTYTSARHHPQQSVTYKDIPQDGRPIYRRNGAHQGEDGATGYRQGQDLHITRKTPLTMSSYDRWQHPTRGDVTPTNEGVRLTVKWAKNLQKVGQTKSVTLPRLEGSIMCPVAALMANFRAAPTKNAADPLLMFPDTRRPIPTSLIRKKWDAALARAGVQAAKYSLHSSHGCTEIEVQRYGGWRSTAYKRYIYTPTGRVTAALAEALPN